MLVKRGGRSGKSITGEFSLKKQIRHSERLAHKGWRMQRKLFGVVIVIILALCAWSPWITQETASKLAEKQFHKVWDGIVDGCGISGNNLGAKNFRKLPFGATVTLDYPCGLVAPNEPALHTTVYIPFFGIAFGYPAP